MVKKRTISLKFIFGYWFVSGIILFILSNMLFPNSTFILDLSSIIIAGLIIGGIGVINEWIKVYVAKQSQRIFLGK